ncbi:ras-related protein Rab-38-like [Astyanax mexicanus]|uniref:RAB38, member RAS onco family n=2 Tax=Astyanax mexicanus TaxID=7994 RepID=A0A3B1IHL7_ASTMX|nr:ras-related protein Rab-38-like [Astyanax mexicanus]
MVWGTGKCAEDPRSFFSTLGNLTFIPFLDFFWVGSVSGGNAAGAFAEGAGDWGSRRGENSHNQALRSPGLLPALQSHHRSGLRPQSPQLGPQDSDSPAAVGHRWKCCPRQGHPEDRIMRRVVTVGWTVKLQCQQRQERYGNMTRVYYREAVGALVVFDMTRASTFQAVLKWKMDLDSKVALNNGRPVPAVLLANKCDQQKQGLCARLPKLDTFSRDHGFVGWYETSAKDNTNIDAAIMCLVENILASDVENTAVDSDPSLLVLPSFDYNLRERSGPGCSACSRRRSTPRDNSDF